MTTGGWVDAILGTWIMLALVLWLGAEAVYHTRRLKAWLERVLGRNSGTYVDMTILQMQQDQAREARAGSDYRKAQHAITEAKGR